MFAFSITCCTASQILILRDLLKMPLLRHDHVRLGVKTEQTDNKIACVMFCQSSVSGKM